MPSRRSRRRQGVLREPVEGVGDAGKVVRPAGAAGHEFLADLVVIVAPIRGILRRALLPGARERQLAATTRGGNARVMTAPDTTTCRVVTTRGRRSARGKHRRGEDRGNARHLTRPLVDVAVESRSSIATRTFEVRVGGCARVASQGSPIGPKPHRGDFARWRNVSCSASDFALMRAVGRYRLVRRFRHPTRLPEGALVPARRWRRRRICGREDHSTAMAMEGVNVAHSYVRSEVRGPRSRSLSPPHLARSSPIRYDDRGEQRHIRSL